MPIPVIIVGIAKVAAVVGTALGARGVYKSRKASKKMSEATKLQDKAVRRFEKHNKEIVKKMDDLGKKELGIVQSFERFSDVIEQIQGRPKFATYSQDDINLPAYEAEELRKVSVGASVLMGGLGGAAAGTAAGFAAAGATTSAVAVLGTASTGTAIASLSGVAATNATLAAIGGGSIAAGGGGVALGTAVLGVSTLGIGLLVGGIVFSVTGSKLSDKADEAYKQAQNTDFNITNIIAYFDELKEAAESFSDALDNVNNEYQKRLEKLKIVVEKEKQWTNFTEEEKLLTKNVVLFVELLYKMCNVKLVLQNKNKKKLNKVNDVEIDKTISEAKTMLKELQD